MLVGDNPFHGISHLSDDHARSRSNEIFNVEHASHLVYSAFENGANGFMFSVSDTTLPILKLVCEKLGNKKLTLYPILPYAYEYVRLATQLGTIGLGKKMAFRMIKSGNLRTVFSGLNGITRLDPKTLFKTYLNYEIHRIKSSIRKKQEITSILLHEVVTDMALALDLDWFFKFYMQFFTKLKIKPGFETRNFSFLVNKFREWNIDFSEMLLVSAFNKIGFQMNPSKKACEKALMEIPECDVIAMSILAAGYLRLPEAVKYIKGLPNITGMVVGVSKKRHASETFNYLRDNFSTKSLE